MTTIRRSLPALLLALLVSGGAIGIGAQRTSSKASTDPALDRATEMRKARSSASAVATELKKAYRVDDARSVQILHRVGFGPDEIARASTEALRADARTTAKLMSGAGLDAVAVATGLARGARVTGTQALTAMDRAGIRGVGTVEVYKATRVVAGELSAYLHAKGESAAVTAKVLADVHRLSNEAVAKPLLGAYDAVLVARFLKDELKLDAGMIERTLVNGGVPQSTIGSVMRDIGLAVGEPSVARYWIRDYALGAGPGDIIENAEIVNRSAILQGPSEVDGVVWIEGENLNHPEAEVWAGTTGGSPEKAQIVSRQTVGGLDRLEVKFFSMRDPGFRVTTPGGDYEVGNQAWPVGYAAIERTLIEDALEGLSVSVDDGSVEITVGDRSISGDVDENRENGIETQVTDLNSNGFEVSTEAEPGGGALVLTISFEEQGREFEGNFFGYIPCWKCSSFTIPQSECAVITLNCVMDFLGEGMASLASCANPENWEEVEILDTDGVPFDGDLANTVLTVRMAMHVDGGGLGSSGTTYDFGTNVSLATSSGGVSLGVVDPYVRSRVRDRLTSSMSEIDLAADLATALNQYAAIMGWGTYLTMAPMPNGRFFVSFPG